MIIKLERCEATRGIIVSSSEELQQEVGSAGQWETPKVCLCMRREWLKINSPMRTGPFALPSYFVHTNSHFYNAAIYIIWLRVM